MQTIATEEKITKESINELSERETVEQVKNALLRIFKTTSAEVALPAFEYVDEDVDGLLLWIDENIAKEYKLPADLARAYDALAEADKLFGRIRRSQYYRYYVYIYNLLTAGIALAKDKKYSGMEEYKPTNRILKLWIYNQKNAKRKALAETLAPKLHTSKKNIIHNTLPFLKIIARKNPVFRKQFIDEYRLPAEQAEWLLK
ncbi:TPA: hypothetical protein HA251_08560 [Candidatus Woesearchaeota archaeon]|nr:hypothetical protein [Candidatus Woesearchaeota archaeon]